MQLIDRLKSPKNHLASVTFLIILWIVISFITYHTWIHGADHRDFYPRWAGARLLLFDDFDLYTNETTREMQTLLYGAPLPDERDQQGFAYPAQLVIILFPLWFISNVEVATAIWVGLSAVLLLLTLLLIRNLWGTASFSIILAFVLWHYSLLMLFQGQITALILASIGISYWAYRKNLDFLTGVLLSIGLVKPELVLLPVGAILVMSISKRRYSVFIGFVISLAILFLTSIAAAGWWLPGWIQAITRYAGYAKVVWPLQAAWGINPIVGLALIISVIVILMRLRISEPAVFAASIPLGMLLFPQTLIWSLTMLAIPLTLSWRGNARYAVIFTLLLGWILILGSFIPEWWKVQTILMPTITLGVVSIASRSHLQSYNDIRTENI